MIIGIVVYMDNEKMRNLVLWFVFRMIFLSVVWFDEKVMVLVEKKRKRSNGIDRI